MTTRAAAAALAIGWAAALCAAEPLSRVSWSFDGEEAGSAWTQRANHCESVRLEGGALKGVTSGADPFLTSPAFCLDARAGQAVEFRARYSGAGRGELFWMPAGASTPKAAWSAPFEWAGDGEWHDYRVRPFWQGEKQIGAIRIDFVNGRAGADFEVDWVRVVEEPVAAQVGQTGWLGDALAAWRPVDGSEADAREGALWYRASASGAGSLECPCLSFSADAAFVLAVEMAAESGDLATVAWASDAVSGLHKKTFRVKPDGRPHTYNVDLSGEKAWAGNIVLLRLAPTNEKGGRARVLSVRAGEDLMGPADVSVLKVRLVDAVCRAGRPATLLVQLGNGGGRDSTNAVLSLVKLPKGVRVASAPGWERAPVIPASGVVTHTLTLAAERAVSGALEIALDGDGADGQRARATVEFLPDLKLPKAAYVPEPKPVSSGYEIGALYYPGWAKPEAWARIWPVAPERKPLLGWYDEANPEVVDWQIKWAVENGLSYFLVDWYWHKGSQHNDHWIKAFGRARYRSYLKWAVMWANHNAEGSHSESDQRAVSKFWIDNYFRTPEYYRIDGKPVVMIWSPQNMNRDLKSPDGCKRLLDITRGMAAEAGLPGVYFIAMKWPEASWEPEVVRGLKDMGFDMTSIYHYMGHGGKAQSARRFAFDLVADSNREHWEGLRKTGILPFLPNLSTGWDDRPWHGDKGTEIYGRTVRHFARICRDAKRFADESGVKRLTLAPLNEWGEGSYAEPCAQFGFGMYEAVRETFCEKPAEGWPLNFGPQDVGLGPYDLPAPKADTSTAWTFAEGAQGWSATMGIDSFKAGAGGLTFTTRTRDPAIERMLAPVKAKGFSQVVVRMRVPAGAAGACQLFWSSGGTPAEATSLSLPLRADGQAHDYVFDVAANRSWRGRVGRLRFDPCSAAGVQVAIEAIRLVSAQ
jgi:hypothetical protein